MLDGKLKLASWVGTFSQIGNWTTEKLRLIVEPDKLLFTLIYERLRGSAGCAKTETTDRKWIFPDFFGFFILIIFFPELSVF